MKDINSLTQEEFKEWMAIPENGAFISLLYKWALQKAFLIDETSLLCFLKGVTMIFLEAEKALENPDCNGEVKWQ